MKRVIYTNIHYDRRYINDYMKTHEIYPQYYKTTHGLGPGMMPYDVHIVDHYETDYVDYLAFDRTLTPEEIRKYDLRQVNGDELANLSIGPYYKGE